MSQQQRNNRPEKADHHDAGHGADTARSAAATRGLQQQMNVNAQAAAVRQQQLVRNAQSRGQTNDVLRDGTTPNSLPTEQELKAAAEAQRAQGLVAREINVQADRPESPDVEAGAAGRLEPNLSGEASILGIAPSNLDQVVADPAGLSDAEYIALINQTFARFSAFQGTVPSEVDIRGFWEWLREMGAFGRPAGNRRISKALQLEEELRFFLMMLTQILDWFLKVCAERGQPLPPSMQKVRQMVEYLKKADPNDPNIGQPAAALLFDESGTAVKADLKPGDDTATVLRLDLKRARGRRA